MNQKEAMELQKKQSKYSNVKTSTDGITFSSKKEAKRYQDLRWLEKAGSIKDLKLQVKFEIYPRLTTEHGVIINKRSYIADFVYYDNQIKNYVIEDSKGYQTKEFRMKWRQMQQRYTDYDFVLT